MHYDLDKLPIKILKKDSAIEFFYNNKIYFFKACSNERILKEILAGKIAKRFGIACCHYIPASYKGIEGVVSEAAYGIMDSGYREMDTYIIEKNPFDPITDFFSKSNLEDLWNEFYYDPNIPPKIVKRLMNEVTDIFIFDVLIGNADRHGQNMGIILNGVDTHMAPIFDHDRMLSNMAIKEGDYCLSVEPGDTQLDTNINYLYKFLDISDKAYHKRLKEGLEIISEESLLEIFKEIKSEGIDVDNDLVEEILEKFAANREMINHYFIAKEKIV